MSIAFAYYSIESFYFKRGEKMKIIIIGITVFIYIGMLINTKKRTATALFGAGVLLLIGSLTSVFDPVQAFSSFPSEIIILLTVLSIFTDIFETCGVMNRISYQFIELSKGNQTLILITLPFIIFFSSLFMNNLSVVLLFTSMSMYLARRYHFSVSPILVSLIIASNIGGAALPWADTPAVILTLYTDFSLFDFLSKLLFPCFLLIICLSGYTYIWYRFFSKHRRQFPNLKKEPVKWKELKRPLILFIGFIISLCVAPFFNISIAYVSLIFGGLVLLVNKKDTMDTLNDLPLLDSITFLIPLFLIGGVLEQCGILSSIAQSILSLTQQNPYYLSLSVLMLAYIIATFLSAGPAAATLLPICTTLSPLVPDHIIYAALALGILAGSSMLPWSATGGPILLGQTRKIIKHLNMLPHEKKELEEIFILKNYISFSIPFSLFMIIFNALYLVLSIFLTI